MEINEEDERALAAFMSKDKAAERTLGDIILQKIMEKDAEVATGAYAFFNCYPVIGIAVRSPNHELF